MKRTLVSRDGGDGVIIHDKWGHRHHLVMIALLAVKIHADLLREAQIETATFR